MAAELLPLGLGEGKSRPKLRAVGIGGAGCNAISSCSFDAVALCNARDTFSSPPGHRRIVLSADDINMILATSPRLKLTIEHEGTRKLKEAVGESDMLFLFTGLGGETGSGLTPSVARYGRRSSELVVASAALPFSVEGAGRKSVAAKALPEIMDAAHMTITYPNDALLELTPNLPLRRAFKVMDGIMNIPAAELSQVMTKDDIVALRSDLSGVKQMRLGMGQGQGMRKEELALSDTFTSPWFDFPLEDVKLAIVILTGGGMDRYAVKEVMDHLLPRMPEARVRYAVKEDPAMVDKLRITLLLGRP